MRRLPNVSTAFGRELASLDRLTGKLAYGFLNEERHPSRVLQERSLPGQRLGELYDHMLASDSDLGAFFAKRHDAVLALPRRIVPGDGSSLAREAADLCRFALGQVPSFDISLAHQAGALEKGIAIDELIWEKLSRGPWAGAWVPVDMIDRPMWRFGFRDGKLFVRRILGGTLEEAPPGKFLVARRGTKDSSWGRALLDELYWPWWVKKQVLKFYATHLDRWADPALVGRYKHRLAGKDAEAMNEADQATILEAIATLRESAGIALPEGLDLSTLEAKRSGAATYEQLIALITRSQATRVLGEVDTSGAAKGAGSYAKSAVSNEVRLEKVVLDAHNTSAHVSDNLLWLIVAVNLGADAPMPRLLIDAVEADDRRLRGEGIESVLKRGLPVSKRYIYQTHQVPEPAPGEEVVTVGVSQDTNGAPSPAAPAPPTPDTTGDPTPADSPGDVTFPAAASVRPSVRLAATIDDELERDARSRVADVEEVATKLSGRMPPYYGTWQSVLAAAWREGKVADGTALTDLVARLDARQNAGPLATAALHGVGLSILHLRQELGTAAIGLAGAADWSSANTPTEAIDYWSSLLKMPKSAFSALDESARRLAFTVAGVNDLQLLGAVHELIGQALAEGWAEREWVKRLAGLFESRGESPLADWHARLIYSNTVRQLWGIVRYQNTIGNPAAKRLTPYLKWLTLDDNRVRDTHERMHGMVFAIGHPIWKTWWIPAGHGCRCDVATINAIRARKLGLSGDEPTGPWPVDDQGVDVQPDPGFGGAPSLEPLIDERKARAEQLVEEGRTSSDTDYSDALRDLFGKYFNADPASLDLTGK